MLMRRTANRPLTIEAVLRTATSSSPQESIATVCTLLLNIVKPIVWMLNLPPIAEATQSDLPVDGAGCGAACGEAGLARGALCLAGRGLGAGAGVCAYSALALSVMAAAAATAAIFSFVIFSDSDSPTDFTK